MAAEQLKIALDETRMMVSGAQVLLGFQLRSAFQDGFEHLPAVSRIPDAIPLMLMTCVVGLRVAPAIHHRVVERGNASWRIYRTIGLIISAALVPFALSLGFDTFIFMERLAAARSGGRGDCRHCAVVLVRSRAVCDHV